MGLHAAPRVSALRMAARGLSPAYFAFVMATGIVSVEAHLLGMPRLAAALFQVKVVVFIAVAALTALRAVRFSRELWLDMSDHQRGPAFLASVAASSVLGSQFVLLDVDCARRACSGLSRPFSGWA